VSSDTTNGGRRSNNAVISGVVNNVWPHVSKAERLSGSTLYRKLFTIGEVATLETLIAASVRLFKPTAANDWVTGFTDSVTKDNTQASWSPARQYGSAVLKTDVSAGASAFVVTVEDSTLTGIFLDADTIVISNKATPDAASGTSEVHTISGTPSVSGNDVTITIAGTLANSYTVAGATFIVGVMGIGDVVASSSNYSVNTAGTGDYDYTYYPLILNNRGTVFDSLTFTFDDATTFTCVGASGIVYGSGNTFTDFSPSNTAKSALYFTLEAAGFSGVFAGGDTLTADVDDSSFVYVLKRTVPAACPSLAGNLCTTVTEGESEA
jgi:hypothetical protein